MKLPNATATIKNFVKRRNFFLIEIKPKYFSFIPMNNHLFYSLHISKEFLRNILDSTKMLALTMLAFLCFWIAWYPNSSSFWKRSIFELRTRHKSYSLLWINFSLFWLFHFYFLCKSNNNENCENSEENSEELHLVTTDSGNVF